MKKTTQKQAVKRLVHLIQIGLKDYTFEEINEALPKALDIFTEDQIDIIQNSIQEYKIKKMVNNKE